MVTTIKSGSDRSRIKKLLKKLFSKKNSKGLDASKYCGALELKSDALSIQKHLRDEWE